MINVPTGDDSMHNTVDSLKIVALKWMPLIYQCTNPQILAALKLMPLIYQCTNPLDTMGDFKCLINLVKRIEIYTSISLIFYQNNN